MALRSLLGSRSDGNFGFWITRPGVNVGPGVAVENYLLSTVDNRDTPQIIFYGAFFLGPGGSVFLPFGEDIGFVPLTLIEAGSGNQNTYLPSPEPILAFAGGVVSATPSTTGVTVSNGTAGNQAGTVICIRLAG